MPLKLMYITNRKDIAQIAEHAGVDRIFIDMEFIGKQARQGGMDTVQSHHTIEDIREIRSAIHDAELMVRINPIHEAGSEGGYSYGDSKEEIDAAIEAGADILMLPYFKTVEEVRTFIEYVNGRALTFPLLETPEAVAVLDEILELPGLDAIHVGINDLSLGMKSGFMFGLVTDGIVEGIANKCKAHGIPFGFGGIASLGQGLLPAEYIIGEHYHMGSQFVILSRSFCNYQKIEDIEEIRSIFENGVADIRALEEKLAQKVANGDEEFFRNNKAEMARRVAMIQEKIQANKVAQQAKTEETAENNHTNKIDRKDIKNILISGAWQGAKDHIPAIEAMGYKVTFLQWEKDPLPCDPAEVHAIIGNGIFLEHPIEEFTNLKYIQTTSAGYDRVPMDYVAEHGIEIHNARGVYSAPMAEFALAGVLSLYKQMAFFRENQKKHLWEKHRGLKELTDKRVLIVGCGSIGTECATRFSAFGCHVIGIDLYPQDNDSYELILPLSALLDEAKKADIIVMALPHTEETHHMVDVNLLAHMRESAIVVNISRGGVVDQKALEEALSQGKIYGAVLDVFEEEPLTEDSDLWNMENVIVTPHNSFVGEKNRERLDEIIIKNLKNYRLGLI